MSTKPDPSSKEAESSMTAPAHPPPPPPPPEDFHFKKSPFVKKLRTAPPDWYYKAPVSPPPVDFMAPTGPYFYGTLTDPCMIAEILGLKHEPELRPAYIKGYECKLWGQYPALRDAPNSIVEGAAYHISTVEDGKKLAAYETRNYRPEPCWINYKDGKEPLRENGSTFKFVGDPYALSEGQFDLKAWLRRVGRVKALEKLEAKVEDATRSKDNASAID
ncbi:conserved hypothetical protein [Paecilomyces variotii No. 5]|uniref:Putative gamma-glutamylcyclotransferase n=1 Tax=Byssochlamys spectabilis (strain No. 5 / NBRC 109023) TaxID=1356009 RepID=V5G0P1_BYSSN|nr:conserved hypothetical protein [Paecilomyces variotii No. 5]